MADGGLLPGSFCVRLLADLGIELILDTMSISQTRALNTLILSPFIGRR